MDKVLSDLLKNYPVEVKFNDISDFDNFDESRSCIDTIFINIVGVKQGSIEFCPDKEPLAKMKFWPGSGFTNLNWGNRY